VPIVYFDSSAFVKLLVEEYDSDLAAALWDLCDAAVSSRLAYPEVRAALAAAGRAGRIDETGRRSAEATWERFWAATRVVELTEVLGHRAGELAADQGLRGAELVHLASALAVGSETLVAVWDGRLRDGAKAAGLQVVPDS